MRKIIFSLLSVGLFSFGSFAQKTSHAPVGYWQQKADYTMDIDMDVNTAQYKGKQKLVYTNNSPDELNKVYYHLYFNAFQPNSQMDARLHTIMDPDGRMVNISGTSEEKITESRIKKLKPNEIGFIKVNSLRQNGKKVSYEVVGTILEVTLHSPIKSGRKATFEMEFDAQVPLQIRRSGRDSKEGVALSMTQWYPKMAEYDFEGWHTPPYIAREFHGVWGNFDVTLHIDRNYVVGGTGDLLNPQEVGHGYETKGKKLKLPKGNKLTWKFSGKNIHDFTWAADPEYRHDIYKMDNGIDLHFLYKKTMDQKFIDGWKKLQPKTAELMKYFSEHIGKYPYNQYSVIQGGDGGMEYAQCTLISGERSWESLFGVTAHELAHTWFQFLLATNESKHPWMDEGFTTYISNKASNDILGQDRPNPNSGSYRGYGFLVKSGAEEPLSTHADRYDTNRAYGIASYSKGSIFLSQLEYIIGSENVAKTLKEYFNAFSFKHPTPNDFKRIAEKVSGIHLDWYLNEWTQTTHFIDYGVKFVKDKAITLERIGAMPMPIDVEVEYADGTKESFNIPLEMMRGNKTSSATLLKDWGWAYPTYTFEVSKDVKSVKIDKSGYMADINPLNNTFSVE
ncbi:M1 family metallopeptidase [uncultured Tenacibaculum sp.]|uniref:M1 family metallopeptidase n=1 Tax=uncultured Tenacibaculum sp. TaxID=174713 RepID=UPI0026225152|nr:M1 family metallopeptidase [uncultured Tenacibaculum sp.]